MQLEKTAVQNQSHTALGHHQPANSQNHSSQADSENKKKKKIKDKKEEKKQRNQNHISLKQDQEESNEDQDEESTEDLNAIYEPKKQKKIKLHDKEKSQTSIKEKEEQTLDEQENDINSEDKDENEDNEDDYDDLPSKGQSTLSLKKVYTRQASHKNEQVKAQDEDDKINEEDEENNDDSQEEDEEENDKDKDDEEESEQDQDEQEDDEDQNVNKNQQSNKVKIKPALKVKKNKHQDDVSSEDEEDDEDDDEEEDDEEDGDGNQDEEGDNEDYQILDKDIEMLGLSQLNGSILNSNWAEEAMKKLEIDELDEPIDEDQDIEGFDIEQVMKDEKRKQYIESLMECLPPYMYCSSQEEKEDFFEKLNKEFKKNLQIESNPLKHSHKKRVKFNFQKAQVLEFDLTKKVKNISKLPVREGITEIRIN